jgi:hypothetical protein
MAAKAVLGLLKQAKKEADATKTLQCAARCFLARRVGAHKEK